MPSNEIALQRSDQIQCEEESVLNIMYQITNVVSILKSLLF